MIYVITRQRDTYHIQTGDLPHSNGRPTTFKRETYTGITTEITTEKEDLSCSPPKGKRPRKKSSPTPQALEVLSHLCQTTGRDFRVCTQIDTLLNTGVTPQECLTVIDWLHAVKRQEDPEWCERWFDNVTPFRPANFDKYRVRAVEWKAQNALPQNGHIDSLSGERIIPRKMVL